VAGLTPDGNVFSAGGDDEPGATQTSPHSIEVYKPPYQFWGPRPVVSGVAPTWILGSPDLQFTVLTRQGTGIVRVGLIRIGSITHGFDSDQRYIRLNHDDFESPPGSHLLTVNVPAQSRVAPEGDYMMFVVDSLGVPSVATIVRMQ
jgi:hypothetical protein